MFSGAVSTRGHQRFSGASAFDTIRMMFERQSGHVECCWSHGLMHSLWNRCMQGRMRTRLFGWQSCRQMAQLCGTGHCLE